MKSLLDLCKGIKEKTKRALVTGSYIGLGVLSSVGLNSCTNQQLARFFEQQPKNQCEIYMYNYWLDDDGDELMNLSTELEGKKDSFPVHERIEIGVLTWKYKGATERAIVYNSAQEKIFDHETIIPQNGWVEQIVFPEDKALRKEGAYEIFVMINEIIKAKKEFKIYGSNSIHSPSFQ